MITHIEGKLVEKTPTYAIIDCGGVGYMLHISLNTFSKIGDSEKCKLFTHLAARLQLNAAVTTGHFAKPKSPLIQSAVTDTAQPVSIAASLASSADARFTH